MYLVARRWRSLPLAGWLVLVLKDPGRGQRLVPERPCVWAVSDFLGECSRGNGEHRALGVRHAVAADPAGDCPCQHATAAGAHYQQVTGAAGEVYQYPACRAPLDVGLHPRIVRDFSPDGDERIPETLTGQVLPDLAQIARVKPGGAITLGRRPRDNGDQGRIVGAGHNLRVAQCPQTARGATRPGDDAIYASHGAAPSPWLAGHIPPSIRSAGPAVLAPTAPPFNSPGGGHQPGRAQPVAHRATGCMPRVTSDGEASTEAPEPLITHPWRDKSECYECLPTRLPGAPASKVDPTRMAAKKTAAARGRHLPSPSPSTRCERRSAV